MNFDGALDISGSLCCWSPNGRFLAVVASRARLVVRDAKSLDVIFSELCPSVSSGTVSRSSHLTGEETKIDKIAFSPDSVFVYASSFKAGVTHVFQIQKSDPRWKAKITEGVAGLSDITFTPDSRHLLAFSEFNVKLTLWSLVQKKVRYIKYPKNRSCVQFSPDGNYLSVVERRDGRDCVSFFSCTDWTIVKHFETDCNDCAELNWSPRGDAICIWSTPLEYSCFVYTMDGRCIFQFSPTILGLGISSVIWSPCGNLLTLAGCDGKIRLVNTLNWSLVAELTGVSDTISQPKCHVYEETEVPVKDVDLRLAKELFSRRSETEYRNINKRPVHIIADKEKSSKKGFKISDFKYREDGKFLAARCDGVPSTVFVFNVPDLRLHSVLVHRFPVSSMIWGPVQPYSECLTILTTG